MQKFCEEDENITYRQRKYLHSPNITKGMHLEYIKSSPNCILKTPKVKMGVRQEDKHTWNDVNSSGHEGNAE